MARAALYKRLCNLHFSYEVRLNSQQVVFDLLVVFEQSLDILTWYTKCFLQFD